jgi:pimeloyl-ACP methyl ester carboxylesterase
MDEFDIPPGAYWPDEIDKGLHACDTVVGLMSPDSIGSRNVKNEWDWALQNERRLLLLLVKTCTIPHRYVSINRLDATDRDLDSALDALADAATPAYESARSVARIPLPETRYARCGDNSVAYQVFGAGPVDLVVVPGFISHIEHEWTLRPWAQFWRRIASFARVIKFDKRGTGLSDRIGRVLTMEERMDDIRAVMDAARSARAVILGISEGGALATLFAAAHPERTQALIVYGGFASYAACPDYPWPPSLEEYLRRTEEMAQALHERWGSEELAAEILAVMAPSAAGDATLTKWFATLLRLGASPGAEVARRRMNAELDVRSVLPAIRAPTRVLHRVGDRDVRIEEGRYLASNIPGARFVELPGDDHFPHIGDQAPVVAAIETFVHETTAEPPPSVVEPRLATVLCVARPLGGRTPSHDLEQAVERSLRQFGGQELVRETHRTIAIFDGPIRAMRCAESIAAHYRVAGLEVRIGLHSGEVAPGVEAFASEPALLAAQLASRAAAGDVLVSASVRSLSPGSGIAFADLGEHLLRESPLRVYRLEAGSG